jgi:hypothetical protein
MARRVGAVLIALGLMPACDAAAQVPPKDSAASLDRFDAGHGFPAYPSPTNGELRQVPYIFYGGDVNALRLNDVPKFPFDQKRRKH